MYKILKIIMCDIIVVKLFFSEKLYFFKHETSLNRLSSNIKVV